MSSTLCPLNRIPAVFCCVSKRKSDRNCLERAERTSVRISLIELILTNYQKDVNQFRSKRRSKRRPVGKRIRGNQIAPQYINMLPFYCIRFATTTKRPSGSELSQVESVKSSSPKDAVTPVSYNDRAAISCMLDWNSFSDAASKNW